MPSKLRDCRFLGWFVAAALVVVVAGAAEGQSAVMSDERKFAALVSGVRQISLATPCLSFPLANFCPVAGLDLTDTRYSRMVGIGPFFDCAGKVAQGDARPA